MATLRSRPEQNKERADELVQAFEESIRVTRDTRDRRSKEHTDARVSRARTALSYIRRVRNADIDSITRNELLEGIGKINLSKKDQFDPIISLFDAAKEGTKSKFKSRMATEQLFNTLIATPGRQQTVMSPRSNASKGLLGA